jgi:excisionase family DNA binding protein
MTSRPEPNGKLLYGVAEAANALGLGKSTIWALVKDQKLQTVKIGRRTLVTRASIERIAGGNS